MRDRARGVGVRPLLYSLLLPWIASMYLVWQVPSDDHSRDQP